MSHANHANLKLCFGSDFPMQGYFGGVRSAFFIALQCPGLGMALMPLGIWESGHGGHLTACHVLAAVAVAAVGRWRVNEYQWIVNWKIFNASLSESPRPIGSRIRLFRSCQALSISSRISSPGALQLLHIESLAGYCWNKTNHCCDTHDSRCELVNGTIHL